MIYTIKFTRKFRKDYRIMKKRNMDIFLLDEAISKLAQGIPLPESNRDHALVGNYLGHRACHIQPDWLLIYRIEGDILILTLTRIGLHCDIN